MINQILSKLGLGDSTLAQSAETRRRHVRRSGVRADVIVGGQTFGVRDWSQGGVFFDVVPDARLVVGDKVQVTMRFRLPHETIDIQQAARVIRAANRGMAAEFAPLSPEARKKFDRVIDGYHAQSFLESQVA
ncbi:MAG: hypothetical protein GC185_03075 [Alphaproteobacteria bacterium]|nr:hypothetical protein [Alphaproteobacteria bacterium]